MKRPTWPEYSTLADYRRELARGVLVATLAIAPLALGAAWLFPKHVLSIVTISIGVLTLAGMHANIRAQAIARFKLVTRSFERLSLIHEGHAVIVRRNPIAGEYETHRQAFHGALRLGSWAVIVKAYDRYYVLRARRIRDTRGRVFSFRNASVADLVPAVEIGDSLGA